MVASYWYFVLPVAVYAAGAPAMDSGVLLPLVYSASSVSTGPEGS